jgi:hypothetical protein
MKKHFIELFIELKKVARTVKTFTIVMNSVF